jgi:hypothetical protein
MHEELINLLEQNRRNLIEKRIAFDKANPDPDINLDRLDQAYSQIIDRLIEYLKTTQLEAFITKITDHATRSMQEGVKVQAILKIGTNIRSECIKMVEAVYQHDPVKRDKFVRKIQSLQTLSYSTIVNTGLTGKQ